MLIYLIVIILSVFFAFIAQNMRKQYNTSKKRIDHQAYIIFSILSFLPVFLVSAYRGYSVGTDTSGTYYDIYQLVLNNIGGIRDVGYTFINKVAICLFHSYHGVLFLTSLIFCGLSFKSIFEESKYPMFSVLLFFTTNVYFISMNMIRQSIATTLFILAIPFIKKKEFWKFLILILIATSIHSVSLIYIFLYFLLNKKIKIKNIVLLSLITLIFSNVIGNFIINFLLKFSYFQKYFAWYLTSELQTGYFNFYSLLINSCIILFLITIYKNAKSDKDYNILLWLETLSLVSLLFSSTIPLMQRISWMFSFPLYIYLPNMFDYIPNAKTKFFIKCIVAFCFFSYMFVTIFLKGYNEVIPYVSIFN